jgi:hypothetical protein
VIGPRPHHHHLTTQATPPQVYFDITIGGEPAGRVTMGLYGDVVPKVRSLVPSAGTSQSVASPPGRVRMGSSTCRHFNIQFAAALALPSTWRLNPSSTNDR